MREPVDLFGVALAYAALATIIGVPVGVLLTLAFRKTNERER